MSNPRSGTPRVAFNLNNLATLLKATNRLADAEPFVRRAVKIILKSGKGTGHGHPHMWHFLENYYDLLLAMGTSQSGIEAKLREVLDSDSPSS